MDTKTHEEKPSTAAPEFSGEYRNRVASYNTHLLGVVIQGPIAGLATRPSVRPERYLHCGS